MKQLNVGRRVVGAGQGGNGGGGAEKAAGAGGKGRWGNVQNAVMKRGGKGGGVKTLQCVSQSDHTFWLGDLNYRVVRPLGGGVPSPSLDEFQSVVELTQRGGLSELICSDQVHGLYECMGDVCVYVCVCVCTSGTIIYVVKDGRMREESRGERRGERQGRRHGYIVSLCAPDSFFLHYTFITSDSSFPPPPPPPPPPLTRIAPD